MVFKSKNKNDGLDSEIIQKCENIYTGQFISTLQWFLSNFQLSMLNCFRLKLCSPGVFFGKLLRKICCLVWENIRDNQQNKFQNLIDIMPRLENEFELKRLEFTKDTIILILKWYKKSNFRLGVVLRWCLIFGQIWGSQCLLWSCL